MFHPVSWIEKLTKLYDLHKNLISMIKVIVKESKKKKCGKGKLLMKTQGLKHQICH